MNRFFNITIYLIFTIISIIGISVSCQHTEEEQKELLPKAKEIESQTIIPKEINDTVLVELTLVNGVHKVYAKKSGKIINSELIDFNSRKIDSSTLIMSIDNREDFIKLRDLKKTILVDFENSSPVIKDQYSKDFEIFRSAFRLDNLLPEINSERFSSGFITFFKSQTLYTNLYIQAKEIEDEMVDYFYVNESPIFLDKVYVKKGDFVKKGSLLYTYLTDSKLIYQGKLTISPDEIQAIIDAKTGKEIKDYTIKNTMITLTDKLKGRYANSLLVKVVVRKIMV